MVVASTVLYLLEDDPHAAQLFDETVNPIIGSLMQAEGLLGFALGGSERCGAHRTLTVWRDMAAMYAFVASDAHLAAMEVTAEMADHGTRTVHWTLDPATESIDWTTAIERTDRAPALGGLE